MANFQLSLLPERAQRCLVLWEKEVLSGLYGGEAFDEIALELGVTHAEIREAIQVAIRYNLIRRGRGPYPIHPARPPRRGGIPPRAQRL